jgi:hypothetical protein
MQQRDRLTSASMKDVAAYTAKYAEIDMLLPTETELSRVMAYERGLPEHYRVKCAERRFAKLSDASTAMLAAWNARENARGSHAALGNTEAVEQPWDEASSSSSTIASSSSPDPVSDLRAQVAQLTAMMTERFQSSGRGRGGHSSGRSRQREGVPRARSRTPGLSDDLVKARMKAGQCIKCGQAGHYKADCTNEVKLN